MSKLNNITGFFRQICGDNNLIDRTDVEEGRLNKNIAKALGIIDENGNYTNTTYTQKGVHNMANIFNLGNNNFQVKANAVFQTLDAKDGKADGKISASIWNDFAGNNGSATGGPTLEMFVKSYNAVSSHTTKLGEYDNVNDTQK